MATNITSLKFDDGATLIVRMITGSTTWDFEGITALEFLDHGVILEYPNDVESTARVFVPYCQIQQVVQEL